MLHHSYCPVFSYIKKAVNILTVPRVSKIYRRSVLPNWFCPCFAIWWDSLTCTVREQLFILLWFNTLHTSFSFPFLMACFLRSHRSQYRGRTEIWSYYSLGGADHFVIPLLCLSFILWSLTLRLPLSLFSLPVGCKPLFLSLALCFLCAHLDRPAENCISLVHWYGSSLAAVSSWLVCSQCQWLCVHLKHMHMHVHKNLHTICIL